MCSTILTVDKKTTKTQNIQEKEKTIMETKTITEFFKSADGEKVTDFIKTMMKYDAPTLLAVVGTLLDTYEVAHDDFDTVVMLTNLLVVSKSVHDTIGKMEV